MPRAFSHAHIPGVATDSTTTSVASQTQLKTHAPSSPCTGLTPVGFTAAATSCGLLHIHERLHKPGNAGRHTGNQIQSARVVLIHLSGPVRGSAPSPHTICPPASILAAAARSQCPPAPAAPAAHPCPCHQRHRHPQRCSCCCHQVPLPSQPCWQPRLSLWLLLWVRRLAPRVLPATTAVPVAPACPSCASRAAPCAARPR